ncbi:hypothetical protein [Pantoea phage LIMEzero]|uniref:N-acetyltransferase domain-containing protein n=1 Tax=Pantoea phage LIMEzero TaxID=943335 RepID=F4N9T9_9CAUD|nr:hypothetical protein LIMEzero_ORF36 [Pantoea phage LIMEzero]CBY88567.1 hypothetical protein [Pantoea phage LIMEzero]
MKASTKELQTTVVTNHGQTTMPPDLRMETAVGIQAERPWSDLSPQVIVDTMLAHTANGCLDVYVHCDGELAGWAHIGLTFDIHVGECVTVMAMYVRPAYRHLNVPREIIRVLKQAARDTGHRWCAFTHWPKPKTLVWKYIDLGENHGRNF